jgi:hypothetical protein
VSQTLGHALLEMRSEDKGISPVAAEVIRVICGGGHSSGLMTTRPRAKGALGSEDDMCERNRQMAKQSRQQCLLQ